LPVGNDEHLDGGAEVEHLLAVAVLTAVVRGDEDVDAMELGDEGRIPQELPPALRLMSPGKMNLCWPQVTNTTRLRLLVNPPTARTGFQ
jgi:hypothetical protein